VVEALAPGVEVVRGGAPHKTMNVYFIEDEGGVTMFDAGIRAMTSAIRELARRRGGIRRIVLGHSHTDHRGAAPRLDAPVFCHPAERADAETDGGLHYFDCTKLDRFKPVGRYVMPLLLRYKWDGGPVKIAGVLEEGDEVAGFRVVHLPGHAPGQIALWREQDRLALVSDAFYQLDPQTGKESPPTLAHAAFSLDIEGARASLRKLAALEPATAAPGHLGPLTGEVRAQLEHAAGPAA
jgi:glyoxylase-like metal-dependent hydrolase (beta-lactamase superfamily II)